MLLSSFQPLLDTNDIRLRRLCAFFRFLLENIENIHSTGKSYGVDASKCVSLVIFHNFEDASTAEAFQRFGGDVLATHLCLKQSKPKGVFNILREVSQIVSAA